MVQGFADFGNLILFHVCGNIILHVSIVQCQSVYFLKRLDGCVQPNCLFESKKHWGSASLHCWDDYKNKQTNKKHEIVMDPNEPTKWQNNLTV